MSALFSHPPIGADQGRPVLLPAGCEAGHPPLDALTMPAIAGDQAPHSRSMQLKATTTKTAVRTPRGDGRKPAYVHAKAPRCPDCDSKRLRSYRSTDGGDGSRIKYSRCRDCGRRVVVVLE
jgi:hypothetical protein